MRIIKQEILLKEGPFSKSEELSRIIQEINSSVKTVGWPIGNNSFEINPVKKGNGVKPIKNNCMKQLSEFYNWNCEYRMKITGTRPGPIDAVKRLSDGRFFAVEWETGNISSSHRALNKIAVGILKGILAGGTLILPSRNFYYYLTDRVGNYSEIEPYFLVWNNLSIKDGFISVVEIEHDKVNPDVPVIKKGTDGWANYQKQD